MATTTHEERMKILDCIYTIREAKACEGIDIGYKEIKSAKLNARRADKATRALLKLLGF